MIDSSDFNESFGELESLLRSAGEYVQVSKNLRPRVIDGARLATGERRVRRFIRQSALVAALLIWCVTASVGRLDMRYDLRELSLATANAYPISTSRIGGVGGAAWALVDAYTEQRVRQADVLRPKL